MNPDLMRTIDPFIQLAELCFSQIRSSVEMLEALRPAAAAVGP
jgi:hypothetical protein